MSASPQLKSTYSRKQKNCSFSVNTGRLLRAARKSKGLSQSDVANSIGRFNQSDISRLENGSARVFADDLIDFSRLYNRPISYFYNHHDLSN
jgi:transcriptional regulator with XRE-family HTH domain